MSNVEVAIEPRDFHRRPLLRWDLLRVICTIRSRSRSRIYVCMCVGRGVVCRVERSLRKPVLHKLNFIP